ncbi:MAG: hypothetical protein ACREDR_12810, partial [Blastocatellia bacterium]
MRTGVSLIALSDGGTEVRERRSLQGQNRQPSSLSLKGAVTHRLLTFERSDQAYAGCRNGNQGDFLDGLIRP